MVRFTIRLIVTTLVAALGSQRLQAQISPGPLARAHASLEGATNCTQCHGGRKEPTTQRCLACHREIAWLRQQGRGFHARGDGLGTCSTCHPDHAGREFDLIQWPGGSRDRFDHTRSGYALEQSHATTRCAACHKPELRVSAAARFSPRRDGGGWVGLERDCTSCHVDPHRGALKNDCTRCHDSDRWKDAPKFDHARTNYPLTGKHADVQCAACHLAARLRPPTDSTGRPVPVFRPVPFRDCVSCHTSPHGTSLTGTCTSCHVTSSFRTIDRSVFDHDRTRYPLRGRHATVACGGCHVGSGAAAKQPSSATCATCHRDPHAGQATIAGKPVDCASCHTVDGFATPTFTVAQHRSAFPLVGRHAAVACIDCHRGRSTGTPVAGTSRVILLRTLGTQCTACHGEAHANQLAGRQDRGACTACHTQEAWRPTTFNAAAHAGTRFSLDGAHATVACSACHAASRPGLAALGSTVATGSARVALHPPEVRCVDCHADPHAWSKSMSATPACQTCHSTRSFRPASMEAAAHTRTAFPLDGAHRAVPCVACHREIDRPPPTSTLIAATPRVTPLHLESAPSTCNGCHTDPHGGQLGTTKTATCDGCHAVSAFAPVARFDHASITGFALEGTHSRLACASCHRQPANRPAGTRMTYTGLSRRCETCHAAGPPKPKSPA